MQQTYLGQHSGLDSWQQLAHHPSVTLACQVFSTLSNGLLPSNGITSTADVYAWLNGLLQQSWVDPVCGDGVCEAPFEFAAFGRFGCRADCGRLEDIQNLTVLQVGQGS